MGLIVYFIPKFRQDWMVYAFSFGAALATIAIEAGIFVITYITVKRLKA
jgi:hypothetical protein